MDLDAIEAERKRVGDSGEWCRLSAEEVDGVITEIRRLRAQHQETPIDLDAIEAAEKAMTPGPWLFDGWQRVRPADGPQDGTNDVAHIYSSSSASGYSAGDKANGEGIVLLRNSTPALTRRIRDQDAEIARLRAAISCRCECRFETGILVDECHFHECQRSVLLPNGDPSNVTWEGKAARLKYELTRVQEQTAEALSGMQAELIQSEQACDGLRALCGEADITIGELDHRGDYLEERARLRAASKGEQ